MNKEEFPDCMFCAPCSSCDDECGCVPGPCAICGHENPIDSIFPKKGKLVDLK